MKLLGLRLVFESGAANIPSHQRESRPRTRASRHILDVRVRSSSWTYDPDSELVDVHARSGKSHTDHESDREHGEDEQSLRAPEHSAGAPRENGGDNERGHAPRERAEHHRGA